MVGLGSQTTPVTVMGDEVIVGFDPRVLKEKLGL